MGFDGSVKSRQKKIKDPIEKRRKDLPDCGGMSGRGARRV